MDHADHAGLAIKSMQSVLHELPCQTITIKIGTSAFRGNQASTASIDSELKCLGVILNVVINGAILQLHGVLSNRIKCWRFIVIESRNFVNNSVQMDMSTQKFSVLFIEF